MRRSHAITHTYRLAERTVRIYYGPANQRRYFQARQVTRLCDDRHQTTLITTQGDLDAATAAYALCCRWRQENLFGYVRGRYVLDALDTYTAVAVDPNRTVPNPANTAAATPANRRPPSPQATPPSAAWPTPPSWPAR